MTVSRDWFLSIQPCVIWRVIPTVVQAVGRICLRMRRTGHRKKIKTIQYFDVVNFARQVKVPGFYTFGYNDMVCPPTTTYSAYNVINAPKELFVAETTAHYAYAEQWSAARTG